MSDVNKSTAAIIGTIVLTTIVSNWFDRQGTAPERMARIEEQMVSVGQNLAEIKSGFKDYPSMRDLEVINAKVEAERAQTALVHKRHFQAILTNQEAIRQLQIKTRSTNL